jgi:hypothetical protein
MSSLFGSKSKVKAEGGGRLQAIKSMTVPEKCSAISDGDGTVFPIEKDGWDGRQGQKFVRGSVYRRDQGIRNS